ncbi:hypothetical protein ACH0B5_05780 [Ureibacillus sp. 179-F W5.1 NHS]|uniref:hypothetical protein n=1 Tax=Ureibacillus sp. 179-F W5.1 NHS TaxID=3374297 RepID=UPI00387994B8
MSVTINVFRNGELKNRNVFPGKSILIVLDYLKGNDIDYAIQDSEDALEESRINNESIISIDDTNLLDVEGEANFVTEYSLSYDNTIYNNLLKILQ